MAALTTIRSVLQRLNHPRSDEDILQALKETRETHLGSDATGSFLTQDKNWARGVYGKWRRGDPAKLAGLDSVSITGLRLMGYEVPDEQTKPALPSSSSSSSGGDADAAVAGEIMSKVSSCTHE